LYRAGKMRQVRFTLHSDDFDPWPDVARAFPAWTAEQIALLEHSAGAESSPSTWWCRVEPLPSLHWVSIETRSYLAPVWKPLTNTEIVPQPDDWLGVRVEGKVYSSRRYWNQQEGAFGYAFREPLA